MRQNLKKLNPKTRYQFTGTFSAVGFKNNYGHYMPTYLPTNVKYDGQIMTDHLWFNYGKQLSDLGMVNHSLLKQ